MNSDLNDCGCCEDEDLGSTSLANPPGRSSLNYRIGTQPTFLARMLADLTTQRIEDGPNAGTLPLRSLTTRELSDPTIALLDAFACVADVLTFYQERIANECYLGTATERRSIVEFATMVGYELDPGVAATAWLAFTLDDADASPAEVDITPALPVMSVPGPDELPQTYETIEERTLRVAWNALPAATTVPQTFQAARSSVWFQGLGTNLQVGDTLLFTNASWAPGDALNEEHVRTVSEVHTFVDLQLTQVVLDTELPAGLDTDEAVEVYVMAQSVRLYGATATPWALVSPETKGALNAASSNDWPAILDFAALTSHSVFHLEREVEALSATNRFVVQWFAEGVTNYHVAQASTVGVESRSDIGFAATVTRIDFAASELTESDLDLRSVVVRYAARPLTFGEEPINGDGRVPAQAADINTNGLDFDGDLTEIEVGRKVHFTATTTEGDKLSRLLTIDDLVFNTTTQTSTLWFAELLDDSVAYDRSTVQVNANVVKATHGETVSREVLGSGDSKVPNQSFKLKKAGHTWVADDTVQGRSPRCRSMSTGCAGAGWNRCMVSLPRRPCIACTPTTTARSRFASATGRLVPAFPPAPRTSWPPIGQALASMARCPPPS